MKRYVVLLMIFAAMAVSVVATSLRDTTKPVVRIETVSSPTAAPEVPTTQAPSVDVATPTVTSVVVPRVLVDTTPAVSAPVTTPTSAPFVPFPTAKASGTICEISHASSTDAAGVAHEAWGVYGVTSLPRGTVFTFTLTVDGNTKSIPLTAKAGSILISGKVYGNPDGYTDDGTNVFGNTQQDMPFLVGPHGAVSANVSNGGSVFCTAVG